MLNTFFYSNHTLQLLSVIHPTSPVLCSEQQVCDLLAALDITKASGQDGILARMLRYPVPSIASILTHSTIQSVIKLRCHSI